MDKESPQNVQVSKFKSIPHLSVTELFPLEELIIVKPRQSQQTKKRRRPSRQSHPPEDDPSSEAPPPLVLEDALSPSFPQTSVTPREFHDRYLKLLAYAEELNKLSSRIELERSRGEGSELEMLDPGKINRLKVSASLNRMLQRNLRVPSINEVIAAATNLNVREAESCGDDFAIEADFSDNPWSEVNLYRYFRGRVRLDTYQLVSGGLRYTTPLLAGNVHSHLLMAGPKCDLSQLAFHRRATDSYFRNGTDTNAEIVGDHEPIVTLSFYHNVRGHKYKEFDVLASQTLASLTDAFTCSSQVLSREFDLGVKGSCYLLNGVLYPDLRDGACDYSANLLEFFGAAGGGALRSLTPLPQDSAVLNNLALRLYDSGFFLHHGDCEHRVTVTNVRIFDRSRDCPYVRCYPLCTFRPNRNTIDCQVCGTNEASKTVFNSPLLPDNPSHLCGDCYGHFRAVKLGSDVYFDNGLTPSIAIEYNQEG